MLDSSLNVLLGWLFLPQYGLATVFVVSFLASTLLPLGSEPVVFGMIQLRPDLFWPTLAVATVGNTLGGVVNYGIGYGAHRAVVRTEGWMRESAHESTHEAGQDAADGSVQGRAMLSQYSEIRAHRRLVDTLERFGPAACVLAWVPIVGDPLCSVAGWLELPFWRCAFWIALGKLLRYWALVAGLKSIL